ncbi:hypothetical protein D3C86_1573200 [compost metagenome]
MLALNLDHSVLQRAATAAALLQGAGQVFQRFFGQGHATDGGHRLAATAFGFAAHAGDAVTGGDQGVFADAGSHRLSAVRAMPAAVGGIHQAAQGGE